MPIYIASSPWFIFFSSSFYLSAVVPLLLIDWPWFISAVIFLFLALDYKRVIYLHGLRTHQSSVALLVQDCNKWQYQLFSGRRFKAKLIKKRSYCSRLVLILYLRTMTQGRYLIIPRDALSKHNYRFLALQLNA